MNARDDSAVGRFWAEALGWGVDSQEPGVTNLEPAGFAYSSKAWSGRFCRTVGSTAYS
jgi:hypothetical protein